MKQKFGERYELIEQIGGGGMSVVYLAKDLFLDRLVAVKVLRDEFIESDEFIRRFQKEAKAVASLNHPNIVSIYDFNSNNKPIYLVMEYVKGTTLKEKILTDGCISESQALDIIEQIASGLMIAHQARIIHKDIKSQNILIDKDNRIKITDFGIAQILSNSTITHNKGILGSAHYFSPEQARGDIVTYQSDIYSLGIVLYEMLTGELPFNGDNPVTVALKHIQEKPKPPRVLNANLSRDIEAIVLKCLSKHPEARFQSAEEFLKAIRAVKHGNLGISFIDEQKSNLLNSANIENTLALPKNLIQKENQKLGFEENKKSKKSPFSKLSLIFLLTLISLLFAFATVTALNTINHSIFIDSMPEFEGLTISEAENIAKRYGIELIVDKRIYDEKYPINTVITQNPKAGEKISKNSNLVKIILSDGNQTISIPNYSGMHQEIAEKKIKERGLRIGKIKFENSEEIEKNIVISQHPLPGTEVKKDEAVSLVISLGNVSQEVTVPSLIGSSLDDAKKMLLNKGLYLGNVQYVEDKRKIEGIVLSQSISAKQKTRTGTLIDVTINKFLKQSIEIKDTHLSFIVPSSGWLNIEQIDTNGTQNIYQTNANAGDVIDEKIQYIGSGSVNIYIDGELVKEVTLP